MGVYYTCYICGKTEKGFWPCNCPAEQAKLDFKKLVGMTILEVVLLDSQHGGAYLSFKTRSPTGDTVFFRCSNGGEVGEYVQDHPFCDIIDEQEFDMDASEPVVPDDADGEEVTASDSPLCKPEGDEEEAARARFTLAKIKWYAENRTAIPFREVMKEIDLVWENLPPSSRSLFMSLVPAQIEGDESEDDGIDYFG
jgi:hypothetical protein